MNKRKTTALLIAEIHANLDELCSESDDFALGQRYAYLECLEILQLCPAFRRPGIAYDTERRYPPEGRKYGRACLSCGDGMARAANTCLCAGNAV